LLCADVALNASSVNARTLKSEKWILFGWDKSIPAGVVEYDRRQLKNSDVNPIKANFKIIFN
jgi:hypothetical protein